MPFSKKRRPISLQLHIAYLFIGLLLSFALVSSFYHYRENTRILLNAADKQIAMIGERAVIQLEQLYHPVAIFADLIANQGIMNSKTLEQRLTVLPFLMGGMDRMNRVSASFIGYSNGDFFLLRRWSNDPPLRARFKNAPTNTAWVVQSITHLKNGIQRDYLYFDNKRRLLKHESPQDYRYEVRGRGWYKQALAANRMVTSTPYVFFTTRQSGITVSRPTPNGQAVVGVDISLNDINAILQNSRITPHTTLALIDEQGSVLSWDRGVPKAIDLPEGKLGFPKLKQLGENTLDTLYQINHNRHNQSHSFQANDKEWHGVINTIPLTGSAPYRLLIAIPYDELLSEAISVRNRTILISVLLLIAGILIAARLARMASHPLDALALETRKIQAFDFSEPVDIDTHIIEVRHLAQSISVMKSTIRKFLELSSALANESNFEHLLKRLLNELQQVTQASGGIIYLSDNNETNLRPVQAEWQGDFLDTPERLGILNRITDSYHPVLRALQTPDTPLPLRADELRHFFTALEQIEADMTLLVLPLSDSSNQTLGALVLFIDESQQALSPELLGFTTALSGTASVALHTQRLLDEQKTLLESFIQLIAGAIDSKSPYTGGHCQRVPELTKMLAKAACEEQTGQFADFSLSEKEWEELHIASWLHDCGKVTTPEYVVDKATKLETLYDRLHEIRMRFEVLKRDASLTYWQALANGESPEIAREELKREHSKLDDDFAFIANCNEGGEFMDQHKLGRLQEISQYQWQRTLSDRLGISYAEKARKEAQGPEILPVMEALLSDKIEHLIPRTASDKLPDDKRWQFQVTMPPYLYNRGELYNLSIGRGTLNEEERYKINEHIIHTIIMLENLPLPRHLRRIPDIAGGHHEKMDGTGYPRRLRREDMGWTTRMMAIADIFEALTASDRPYKKGKMLSEAVRIMYHMKKDGHIDPDLFDLFLRSGLYLEYAQKHMVTEQIDEVDIRTYLTAEGLGS
ncbi:hypothetical protein HZU77_014610 [Neisseriaceae bacterium TC5R-5]|nr:hypothetical protein [Neisseriaceae bacterium TC5R-5]